MQYSKEIEWGETIGDRWQLNEYNVMESYFGTSINKYSTRFDGGTMDQNSVFVDIGPYLNKNNARIAVEGLLEGH